MKNLDDVSAMCPECTGNGCGQCMGTGNMPKEAHIVWLQDMIKRKNEQIKFLEDQVKQNVNPETLASSAQQDSLI